MPGVLSGMQPKLLLPLTTAALLFGVPAAANAAVTTTIVDATHVTLTGDAADAIDGGDGNDRVTGFRGNDVVNGGNGNDVMIWNNGDGTDDNNGDAVVDEVLVTAGTAND